MPEEQISRADTLLRIVLAIVFWIIGGAVLVVLELLVIFSLVWALITQDPPSKGVRRVSNRVIAYLYRIYRFLTYNELAAPFPFSELPEPVDPPTYATRPREAELIGIRRERVDELPAEDRAPF